MSALRQAGEPVARDSFPLCVVPPPERVDAASAGGPGGGASGRTCPLVRPAAACSDGCRRAARDPRHDSRMLHDVEPGRA